MKKCLTLLIATILMMGGLLAPSGTANAAAIGNIPSGAGGGTYSIELADFQYPVTNGCYQPTASNFRISANNDFAYDYFVVDLTVRDNIGRVVDTFFELEEFSGTYGFFQQFCHSFDAAGTYTATGEIRFETSNGSFSQQITDSYTISNPPAPVAAPPAPPAPPAASVNNRCKNAKAALKKAKKQDKPFSVIKKAQKKKNRVC